MAVLLSSDLDDLTSVPYFLWDDPMTVAELKRRLELRSPERNRLLAKVLREARDTDVWKFTTPDAIWRQWPELSPYLGRRRAFWKFLLESWSKEGLLEQKHS